MRSNAGFTLIEIIVALLLLGILAAVAGMGLAQVAVGYTTINENTRMAAQAELALARITKEIIELMDIPTDSTQSTLYIEHVEGNRSVGLDGTTIKINDTGGNPSAGDILVEGVNGFTLTYWSGNPAVQSSTWSTADDVQQLKAIDVDLRLSRSEGGYVEFATRVAPRNNKNVGGAAPAAAIPAAPRYGCFVATAAFGAADHPAVCVLKEFRDRCLLNWPGGKALVNWYYAVSPAMVKWLTPHPILLKGIRLLLLGLTVCVFLALYAPLLPASLLLVPPALWWFRRRNRRKDRRAPAPLRGSGGSVLLIVIATILVISALTAAIVPMFTTSLQGQAYSDQGTKAYFLAESGFRYAASAYLNAGSDTARFSALRGLDGKTFNLSAGDGSFSLNVYPYWYRVSSVSSQTNVTAEVAGQLDNAISGQKYLCLESKNGFYTGTVTGGEGASTVNISNLSLVIGSSTISTGDDFYTTTIPSANQTVTRNGSLLLGPTGAGDFPLVNGNFRLYPAPPGTSPNTAYTYKKRVGNTLYGIDLVDTTKLWVNLVLTGGAFSNASTTKVILEKYVRLVSRGFAGAADREVAYYVPIGWVFGGEDFRKEQYLDPFNSMANWVPPSGGGLGSHSIQSIGGDNALKVDSMSSSSGAWWSDVGKWAMIFLDWGNTNVNLAQAWLDARGCLGYDLQVKVENDQPYFMAGVNFRARNNTSQTDLYAYGLSFLKPRRTRWRFLGSYTAYTASSDIPTDLIPGYASDSNPGPLFAGTLEQSATPSWFLGSQDQYGLPAIVLWQRTASGFKWLAYRILTTADGLVTYNGSSAAWRLRPWATLMLRLVEGYELPFSNGGGTGHSGVPIKAGDTVKSSDGTQSGRVAGTPILLSGSWYACTAHGSLILTNVEGSFSSGDEIMLDGQRRARATGTLSGSKRNYMRVYYTFTSPQGTPNAVQTDNNRKGNPRGYAYWPPDDLLDLDSSNDYVTLVQWTGTNNGVSLMTSSSEPGALITTWDLVTPVWTSSSTTGDFVFSQSSGYSGSGDNISLVTASDAGPLTYYDDFALQLEVKTGTGFLPPIQQ